MFRGRMTCRKPGQGALLLGCALAGWLTLPPGHAPGAWSGSVGSFPGTFTGGSFSPRVAPAVTQRYKGVNDQLGWSAVTFTGGTTVTYLVTRIESGGATIPVCTGVNAPVTTGSTVTCTDRKAPKGSQYTEQPVILRAGTVTWSLAPSTPG